MAASTIQELASQGVGSFLFRFERTICACFARSNLYSAKEKLEIVSVRGGAAHFAPPHPSRAPRGEGRIPFEQFQEYTALTTFYRHDPISRE